MNLHIRQLIIKSVSFILLITCISTLFAGCEIISEDHKADKQALINQLMQDFDISNNEDSVEFIAKELAQVGYLSSSFPISVKIDNNEIYIHSILIDQVYIDNSPEISYDKSHLISIDDSVTDEEVFEIINKMQSIKNCYMLESNDNDLKFAVYKINDTYYLLSFFAKEKSEIMRIYYINT